MDEELKVRLQNAVTNQLNRFTFEWNDRENQTRWKEHLEEHGIPLPEVTDPLEDVLGIKLKFVPTLEETSPGVYKITSMSFVPDIQKEV